MILGIDCPLIKYRDEDSPKLFMGSISRNIVNSPTVYWIKSLTKM